MATTVRRTPGANAAAKRQAALAEAEERSRIEHLQIWYEKNSKKVLGLIIGIAVIILAWVGYRFMTQQKEEKATARVFYAQQYFAQDSLNRALNGDGQHPGFLRIIKDYKGTKTANLAQYYAGVSYLKTGDFKNAIKHLEEFDAKGTALATAANGLLGDAYMESGNIKKGIESYKKATSNAEDQVQTPLFLMHLGQAYELNKQPEEAIKAYKRIRDEYPQSIQAQDADRLLAMLGVTE